MCRISLTVKDRGWKLTLLLLTNDAVLLGGSEKQLQLQRTVTGESGGI